jgi:hypothetical protein
MKRQLEEENENEKDDVSNLNKYIELLHEIFEEDEIKELKINIDTKNKEIIISKENINGKNIRKCKYIDKKLKSFLDEMDDDLIYKNIQSFILNVNGNNIFVDIKKWKEQLLNEISYIEILENEEKELVELMKTTLVL